MILTTIGSETLRFRDLKQRIREVEADISEGVLSKTLSQLAADGLIYNQGTDRRPVHALTDLGREIVAILTQIKSAGTEAPVPDEPESNSHPCDPGQ